MDVPETTSDFSDSGSETDSGFGFEDSEVGAGEETDSSSDSETGRSSEESGRESRSRKQEAAVKKFKLSRGEFEEKDLLALAEAAFRLHDDQRDMLSDPSKWANAAKKAGLSLDDFVKDRIAELVEEESLTKEEKAYREEKRELEQLRKEREESKRSQYTAKAEAKIQSELTELQNMHGFRPDGPVLQRALDYRIAALDAGKQVSLVQCYQKAANDLSGDDAFSYLDSVPDEKLLEHVSPKALARIEKALANKYRQSSKVPSFRPGQPAAEAKKSSQPTSGWDALDQKYGGR